MQAKRGEQITAPVNLNSYASSRLYVTYGIPFDVIKSNLNLSGGMNYTHTPGIVNSINEYSNNWVPTGGIVISSNVSQYLDFTLSYTGSYNFVNNSLQTSTNNNYYNHTASFKINWIIFKRVVLNSNIANYYYSTLSSSSGDINYNLWTSYIGYKFLKNKALEARFTVFDILNQNRGVSRIVAANYVENDIANNLKQYGMFQLTYTLRNFKGALPQEQDHEHGPWGPGMRGGGGGNWGGGNGGGPGGDHDHNGG